MEPNKHFKNKEGGRVIAGLILVGVGAALLLRNTGFEMPGWLFSWPMILILVGIYIGVKSNFRNNAWYILILIGSYFLVSRFIPSLGLQPFFWPIVIIALGVIFILRPGKGKWPESPDDTDYKKWENLPGASMQYGSSTASVESGDFINVRSVFSGINKNIVSKNFQGGRISCVFGGSEIDLTQADINGRVLIKLDIAFGGAKLVVPPNWAIQNDTDGAFHGFEDKRSFNPSANINPDKVLILKGSVVFGGVEIKSY
ncbi:MAG: DUF5668 domain-containing protein [Ferruginibacter sp.]